MAITFLEEEPTQPVTSKRKVTFLEEEGAAPLFAREEAVPTPEQPERRAGGGITGGAADIGVSFMKGLGTGTRMISDVFGANNPVSKAIAGYEDYMDGLLSAESKQDSEEISRILKDAEGKGILPQIMAGLEAFTVAPAEMTATTMGMMLPNLAGGVYAKAAQLTKAGALGLQMGIGAAQGIGSVKGQIYTAVQEELRQQGLPEDQIEPIATKAQAYNGKNLDQLLIAGGLGAIAASTGAEKIMTRLITGQGKEATEGLIKTAIKGGVAEAPIEGLQGGQEKLAENIALQRIGVDVPTMQGVIPAAAMEATAGLVVGGGFGGVSAIVSPEKQAENDINKEADQVANELTSEDNPVMQGMVKELARRENAVKNLQDAYDALEPTSQEAQRLKLELGNEQRKLSAFKETAANAGLSVTITPVEQQQIELAKQIAAPVEPAPAEAPAAPVSETITPAVEAAPVTPAPTEAPAITPAPVAETPAAIPVEKKFNSLRKSIGAINPLVGDMFGDKVAFTTAKDDDPNKAEVVVTKDIDDPNTVILENIFVPEGGRGRGLGRSAMEKFLAEVDRLGMDVKLEVDPETSVNQRQRGKSAIPMNEDQLRNWYSKFGFQFKYLGSGIGYTTRGFRPSKETLVEQYKQTLPPIPVGTKLNPNNLFASPSDLLGAFEQGNEQLNKARTKGFYGGPNFNEGEIYYVSGGDIFTLENGELKRHRGVAEENGIVVEQEEVLTTEEKIPRFAPTTAVSETITPAEPTAISVGNRIKLGKSPQTYTVEQVIPQSETERGLGEQFYSVKNERTGEVQTVEAKDLKIVKPSKATRKMAPVRVEEKATPVPEADRYTFDEAGIRSIEFFGGKAPDGLLIVNDTTNPNYEMKAGYDPETGDIILNRAYIRKGESIEDILTHELGHYIFSDPKFQADFKNFLESMPDDTRAEIEAIINQSYNKDTNQTQIEERQVMAFTALVKANKDTLSKWETIKNTIKRWINKVFGTKIKLSDEGAMAVFNVGFKRFKSGERIIRAMEEGTLRTAPEGMTQMDRDYLAAVERGDMETAQRMVDEAAKRAGYNVGPVIHQTNAANFTKFDINKARSTGRSRIGFFFTDNPNVEYGRYTIRAYLDSREPLIFSNFNDFYAWAARNEASFGDTTSLREVLKKQGYDSIEIEGITDGFKQVITVVLEPNQIKSADPVTYDDAGNVIPLSQRFRPTSPDIRRMAAEPRKPAEEAKPITDPATPEEQTQQQVQSAQEQESIVDSAVKEAGATVFDVFNRLVNEGKTEEQVSQELGISKFEVRKLKLRADTAILNKMKQKKVQPLAFQPKNPVVDFAGKNAKKYFTKEGWLPKMVYQSWVKRNAVLSREQKEAEYAIKDLYDGIRKVFGISKMEMITKGLVSVPPDFVQQLNDALAGQININTMPEPVREPLTRMRQHIDTMSRQLVDLNVLPDDLAAKISDNLGIYLTRSYKIFTDKNWINKIPQEKLNNARNFLYKQQLKSDPTATIEMADRELRNMLNDWASEAEGLRKRGGKLGAKDLSVMMKRSEVPKVLREVMGENMNVVFNYANTIGKISRFLADQRFLNEVKAKGTGQFLFTAADAPQGFNTQIAAEESRTMSPLNGLRTTPEIAKAFEEFGKGYDAKENPFLYALGWLNAVGKLNLTVGSILTQMRNMLGQPAFFVFNGHYNWSVIRQEVDAIAKEKGISKEDAKRELIKQAAAQGLVNENAYAGELRTAFQEVGLETFDDAGPDEFVKEFVLTRMFKQGVRSAQDLYQKTDEFGKLVGWLNETKRIQRMNKGMDKATAQSIAAERTRDTYPTYSQSSEALRLFRRQPFIGPFATFFYETFRTSFHNLRYAFEDMKGPTPEHKAEGRKRLAGAMAQLSAGAFAVNLISQAISNIGDDEEEDVRRMLPPWAKDASILWLPKSKDGTYNFINLSYINPYNALTDPFIAMMSGFAKGEKPEEIATQAFGSFLSPFVDEQPVSAAIVDAMRNRTETGKQVYNPQDDIATKTSKIMLHIFGKTFTPGTLARLNQRIIPAIEGETVGTRAPAPVREVTAELTGIRFETLDMKAAFSNKAWEFSKAANESERIFRDIATRRRRVNEQEQIDAYRRSEQTRYEIWNEMYRDYMAVRRAGASQSEAIRLMTDIGISKKEAQAIARGRYTPYEISDEVKRRSKLNGNTVPLTQIKAIGREMPKVLTDIPAE